MPRDHHCEEPENGLTQTEKELRIVIEHPHSRPPSVYDWHYNPPPIDNFGDLPPDDQWENYVADSWRRVHDSNDQLQRQVQELTREKDIEMSRRYESDKALCDFREQSSQIEAELVKEKTEALDEVRRLQSLLDQERASRLRTIEDAVEEATLRVGHEAEELKLRLRQTDKESQELREACSGLRSSLDNAQAQTKEWFQDCQAWEDQCKEWMREREHMRTELSTLSRSYQEAGEKEKRTERELARLQSEAQDSLLEFARLKEASSRNENLRADAEKSQASAIEELRKISLSWEQASVDNERLREETAMLGAKLRGLEEIAARTRMDLVREEQATARLRDEKQDFENSTQAAFNALQHKHEVVLQDYNGLERTVAPMKSRQHGLICETQQLRASNQLLRRELDAMRAENYELKLRVKGHVAVSTSSRKLSETETKRPVSARMPAHVEMKTGEDSSWSLRCSSLRDRLNAERFTFEYRPPEEAPEGRDSRLMTPRKPYQTVRSPARPRSAR